MTENTRPEYREWLWQVKNSLDSKEIAESIFQWHEWVIDKLDISQNAVFDKLQLWELEISYLGK